MQAKYIVWVDSGMERRRENARNWVLFPEHMAHATVAEMLGVTDRVLSAGFWSHGNPPCAGGESFSLGRHSHPDDTRLILSGMAWADEVDELLGNSEGE